VTGVSLIVEVAKLAATGVVAAIFTSAVAYRDHRRKTWWELRVAAYKALIEALSDLVYYDDAHFTAELYRREISPERSAELNLLWRSASAAVRKAADAGAFIFSEDVHTALAEYRRDRDDPSDSYFDSLEKDLIAARACLRQVVAASRGDLSLDAWRIRLPLLGRKRPIGAAVASPQRQ
jgi:hypothetical protein